MFLHVTNQYLVNIVHTTSCLLSLFVLDSSMPTLFYLWFCRNALILLHLFAKILYRKLVLFFFFFLMVVMPLMLTLLWCEYTWFTDVQGWGGGNPS